jgi:hypothetical protein
MSVQLILHNIATYGGDLAGDITGLKKNSLNLIVMVLNQLHTMISTNLLLGLASLIAGKTFIGSPFQCTSNTAMPSSWNRVGCFREGN